MLSLGYIRAAIYADHTRRHSNRGIVSHASTLCSPIRPFCLVNHLHAWARDGLPLDLQVFPLAESVSPCVRPRMTHPDLDRQQVGPHLPGYAPSMGAWVVAKRARSSTLP